MQYIENFYQKHQIVSSQEQSQVDVEDIHIVDGTPIPIKNF